MVTQKKANATLVIIIAIAVLAVAAAGVYFYPYSPDKPIKTDDSEATSEGIQKVVEANNKFAFDLYSELNKGSGNIFYSPYSISAALAMTYEGARGETAKEIKSVFNFPENEILRPNFASVYNNLNEDNGEYELKTGNALWLQKDYPFIKEFVETVEDYYGGKAAELDFVKDSEGSREIINSFIEEQTNDKIKDLIPPGTLSDLTRMVLTNAIYFKGTWEWEFDKTETEERNFKITPENVIKTPMMFMEPEKTDFNYADTGDLQILELPYKGEKISMLILLPTEDLESVTLNSEKLNGYKSKMKETSLDAIYIPKFEFDTKYFMGGTLRSLGMPTAFSSDADFSGMTLKEKLFISEVIHQAYVKVDEEGTEAAAATAVIMDTAAVGPTERRIFNADHPFVFIIQEKETGNILFLGKVADPRAIPSV